jgi:hypothetical protein
VKVADFRIATIASADKDRYGDDLGHASHTSPGQIGALPITRDRTIRLRHRSTGSSTAFAFAQSGESGSFQSPGAGIFPSNLPRACCTLQ